MPVNRHADPVSYSEDGDDDCRSLVAAFKLSSEATDKHIDCSVGALWILRPDRIKQHFARHSATAGQ